MMAFTEYEDGTTGPQEGFHDDRVVCSAIAIQTGKITGLARLYPSLAR